MINADENDKKILNIPNAFKVYLYWMDKDLNILGANFTFAQSFGLKSVEECIGKNIYYIAKLLGWSEEFASEVQKDHTKVIQSEKENTKKYIVKLTEGQEHTCIIYMHPLNIIGKSIGLVGVILDITDVEKLEAKSISESKYLVQQIIDAIPAHVYWMDKNTKILGANISQVLNFGFKKVEDFIGKDMYDFGEMIKLDKGITEYVQQEHRNVIRTGKISEREYTAVLADEKEHTHLSYKCPLRINDEIVGLVGIAVDITDHKRAEILQKEKEILERTVKFTEGISGILAHELRTPLAVIQMQADLLDNTIFSKTVSITKQKSFFKKTISNIRKTISSASYVISDLLMKIRSLATGKLDRKEFSEQPILEDIEHLMDLYPFEVAERELVKVNIEKGFLYKGDGTLTKHVLYNLMKNALYAIKETNKGNIVITLKTGVKFNELLFRDTAIGIKKEFLGKVFVQFETKEKVGKGTGLGLPFCKMIMKSYGGDITVDSKEGEYTEFVLYFPKEE